MKTNKYQSPNIASYTGYSKTKKYRVNVHQVKADKDTVFAYYADMYDLRTVIDSYIEDLSNEEDFQIFLKLNQESENGYSTIDCKVIASFENSTHWFYPPEPQYIYTDKGKYTISAEELYDIRIAYTMITHEEDYQIKILELFQAVVDKNENASIEAPAAILYLSYDPEINMWEAYPLTVSITYEPKHAYVEGKIAERDRVIQFRNFVDKLSRGEVLMAEKSNLRKW